MSEEKKKKIVPEEAPPLEKRSMVSEDDLLIKEAAEKIKKGENVEIPSEQVLLLFIAEGMHDLNQKMDTLISIFQKASKTVKDKPKTPIEEVKTASPLEISQAEDAGDRVKMIVKAFEPYTEDVTLDTDSDPMFVVVRPRGFLGKEKFAQLGRVSKSLDGTYVSQGKASHFKIPKIVEKAESKQEPTQKPQQEQLHASKTADPPTELESIKMMFPESLEVLLSFTEKEGKLLIKPRQFLGTENFTKIASIVRAAGGDYVSDGKNSHFRVDLGGK